LRAARAALFLLLLAGPAAAADGADPEFRPRGFRVVGSTVFSPEELDAALAPWMGRELASEDLAGASNAITRLYVDRGYLTSGATVPDQPLTDGLVEVRVVEGGLDRIDVVGETRFRPGPLRSRIALGLARPLDVNVLRQNLEILQQDPRIARVHARLVPGERRGEAVLVVRLEEAPPWNLDFESSNYEPVAFGSYRGQITAGHRNLFGLGDVLDAQFTGAEGVLRVDAGYEVPLGARGTLASARGEWAKLRVVEEPFDDLDIETDYYAARLLVEHPFYRSRRARLAAGVLAEWRRTETCFNVLEDLIGCDPFSFQDAGADDGQTTVSVLRAYQEWTWRDLRQVVAARSTFSFGVPVLGASSGGVEPDGSFFAWLAQVQWVRRWGSAGVQTVLRADAQLTNGALPALERFAVGGHASVRGYREYALVRDEGAVGSAEVRVPLWRAEGRPVLELAPFADVGWSSDRERSTESPEVLASVGLGLRLALTRRLHAALYWGYPLVDLDTPSDDLQDEGVQFEVVWDAF
jgi:hemolysin activation/secretion protein